MWLKSLLGLIAISTALACGSSSSIPSDSNANADASTNPDGSENVRMCESGLMPCGSECIQPVAPTAASIHSEVFVRSCASSRSCHTGSNPKEMLDLTDLDDMAAMVGKRSLQRPELALVEPFAPEQSYLMNKLRGVGMAPRSSTGLESLQMPRLAPPLCSEILSIVEEWIRQGAL